VTYVNISPSDRGAKARLARSDGRVEISFAHTENGSSLRHLFQSGCGRVRFPHVEDRPLPEAVLINTAGGLTGGDQMIYEVKLAEKACLTVTGQAAEKIYKSLGDDVCIETDIHVDDHAYLEWLPQETILFEKGRLHRTNRVNLSETAQFLGVEATFLGRRAHGESLTEAALFDGWEIRKAGRLVWYDRFRFEGNMDRDLAAPALLGDARAFGTLILSAPAAGPLLDSIREMSANLQTRIGATLLEDDFLVIRLLDEDAKRFRESLVQLIQMIRKQTVGADIPLPTVWKV
jgi:urease accessory protein